MKIPVLFPLLTSCIFLTALPAQAQDDAVAPAAAPAAVDELPLDEIRVFTEVLHLIKRDYVEKVDDKTLLENAIRGMLTGLDPHSSYLDRTEYQGLQEGTTGEFGGLGLEVGLEDGFIRVISPIDDTPAQRAGVKAGDLIIRLDETPVKGMSLDDAIEHMRGDPGTPISLTIIRENETAPLTIVVMRDIIKVASIRKRMLEPGLAYVRISQFQATTGTDLRDAVVALMDESGGHLNGMILDLRNNPGGVLGASVGVADVFLESGQIVHTKGRMADSVVEFRAKPPDLLEAAPLIVLVNEGSASASEIVAGALQDRRRALIVGRQTFGKGSVQTIIPMPSEAALKLTTALYYTPSGRSIQAEGIKPDIIISNVRIAAAENAAADIVTEANLTRHLQNATPPSGETATPPATPAADPAAITEPARPAPATPAADLATEDYELYEALNLLKGMVLIQNRGQATAD